MSYIPKDILEAANEAVKFAEDVLHIELLPWQKYYVAIALAIGAVKEER